jgi:4-hydroxyphenylpyruvate dioxygenase
MIINQKQAVDINSRNPIQLNGFDFIEFTTKFPQEIINIFTKFGFVITGRHQRKNIFLLEQGKIKFIVNAEANTDAASFESIHGSGVCGISFRVKDSNFALKEAVKRGAKAVICSDYDLPAIESVGGSKIYLIDRQTSEQFYKSFFEPTGKHSLAKPKVTYIDHITQNVFKGNMDAWAKFYECVFNFQEIRFFDIKGKKTALRSKALVSPCGKIRIPLNESQDEFSQIAEFLEKYNGEGIQHIALGCHDIYSVVGKIKKEIAFQDTPNSYYELINKRIPIHKENIIALQELKILIDGGNKEDGILLQIFTKEIIGPIFFEFIERKGNQGFGEGNFQALFESIELDQMRRGVLGEFNHNFEQTAKTKLKHPMLLDSELLPSKEESPIPV